MHKSFTMSELDETTTKKQVETLRAMKENKSFLDTYAKLNIPPPSLNGGLYTGEPFKENAPHANIPIIPDTGYIIHYAMRSAHPPPPVEALYQYPDNHRPGNNTPIMPGIGPFAGGKYGIMCQNSPREKPKSACHCPKCSCYKYFHL